MAVSTRVGIISDTHGNVPDEVLDAFAGVDAIVHAGDVAGGYDLDVLRAIAPLHAVRGNCDDSGEAALLPRVRNVEIGGVRFLVAHQKRHLSAAGVASAGVVVTGHSHHAAISQEDGKLFLDPGSAGDPRGGDRATVAIVEISRDGVSAHIVEL